MFEHKAPPTADDLITPDEDARLQFVIEATYRRVLLEMHHLTRDALELSPTDFRLDDAATRAILQRAAERVVGISETTRQAIADKLHAGQAAGLSTQEIADSIANLFSVTWKSRPETIAATEIAEAQRVSAIDRYTATGLVDRVKITDAHRGTDHTETCLARNGTTMPLDEAPELDHPNCLAGGQLVFAPNALASSTRWFDGEVVVLRTAANDFLTVTPNHPILTDEGWIAAGRIKEGDSILRCASVERLTILLDPENKHTPALIEDVAHALGPACGGTTTAVPTTAEDFHGAVLEGEVYVIRTNRLAYRPSGVLAQQVANLPVQPRDMQRLALAGGGGLAQRREGGLLSPTRGMGRRDEYQTFRGGHARGTQGSSLARGPGQQAPPPPRLGEIGGIDAQFGGDAVGRLTGQVAVVQATEAGILTPTRVLSTFRRPFSGHVYNLQTQEGWYVAENIITHNCSLVLIPLLRGGA